MRIGFGSRRALRVITTHTSAVVALVVAGACQGDSGDLAAVARSLNAVAIEKPWPLADRTLTDQRGNAFDLRRETAGKFVLLYFGYTYCPDICPPTIAAAKRAVDMLDVGERDRVVTVFVSVDPRRDSPERIGEWLAALRSDAVGLRAPSTEVDEILRTMGYRMPLASSRTPGDTTSLGATLVHHPSSLFLVTPDGQGRFQFRSLTDPTEIHDDLVRLMEMSWTGP